ncbi:MAG: rhodanese-like domain-containing protein [Thermodesulfovibrionales bacterium]|jgi:rhodanese-related sulfurtransferase
MGIEKIFETLFAALIITSVVLSQSFAGTDVINKTIDTIQLHSMIVDNAYEIEGGRKKQFTVIDARTEEEYDEGHIFSAINIPEKDFEKSINLLPQDKNVLLVVYCNDTKGEESYQWATKAAAAGYLHLVIYADGFQVWKKNKMPVAPLNNGI